MNSFIFYLKIIKNLLFFKIEFEFFYLFLFFLKRKDFYKNKFAVDVGSNYGIYSLLFSRFFKKVNSFEPIKKHFMETKNLFHNVSVHNYALGNKNATDYINIPIVNNKFVYGYSSIHTKFNKFSTRKIYVKKLDHFYKYKSLDFIKIDVEGYETQVIKGALKLITKFKPIIMVEIEKKHNEHSFDFIFNQLKKINYHCYYLQSFKLKEITSSSIDINRLSDRRYINNFLFLPK